MLEPAGREVTKLTEKEKTVLFFLARRNIERDGGMTGAEIGQIVFQGDRKRKGRDQWAAPALRSLWTKGLAEQLGTVGRAHTWGATEAGRWLDRQEEMA